MRLLLSALVLWLVLLSTLAEAEVREKQEFPGGATFATDVDRKNNNVACLVWTPMRGARAVVRNQQLWFLTDPAMGAVISRLSQPTAQAPDEQEVNLVAAQARAMAVPRSENAALIAALYAGRALTVEWTDVKGERHKARIDPGGFAAAYDAAIKACRWPPATAPPAGR
jgi:hypothetical protein